MTRQAERFVKRLTDKQRQELHEIWKEHGSHRVRCRAHAVLLSDRGWSINQLCDAFQVSRPTASGWLERWEAEGASGLEDDPRSGAPPKLDEAEQATLLDNLKKSPQNPQEAIEQTEEETGKRISRRTLRRIAQRADLAWKRVRKSTKDRQDPRKFACAQSEIEEFRRMEEAGEIHLWFFDEAGFSLTPPTPFAWQPVGETIHIPSRQGGNLSALGFLDLDCQLHPYEVEGTVNSEVVIQVFDNFASHLQEPSVVILDNAPVHTSSEFQNRLPFWADQGLFTYFLPPYSPELNLIEILWREIKNRWLPFSAYRGKMADLWNALGETLAAVGNQLNIKFAAQ